MEKNQRIILPIHKPLINHIPADSYLLSIIGNTEAEMKWIMGNFINLRLNPKLHYSDFYRNDMWYNCYFIYENSLTWDFIKNNTENIVDFFVKQIENGFYIYSYLNAACISNYQSMVNTTHNPLLYGYDLNKKIFHAADFFQGGKLHFSTFTFQEVENAFEIKGLDSAYILFRFIKKINNIEFQFDIHNTVVQLESYISGRNMYNDGMYHYFTNDSEDAIVENVEHGFDFVFGIEYYDGLKEMCMEGWDSVKAAHLLVVHKELMRMRISFFFKNKLLKDVTKLNDLCSELICKGILLRNIMLKTMISDKYDYYGKIISMLSKMKELDIEFSNLFLEELLKGRNFT